MLHAVSLHQGRRVENSIAELCKEVRSWSARFLGIKKWRGHRPALQCARAVCKWIANPENPGVMALSGLPTIRDLRSDKRCGVFQSRITIGFSVLRPELSLPTVNCAPNVNRPTG